MRVNKAYAAIALSFYIVDASAKRNDPDTSKAIFTQIVNTVMTQAVNIAGIIYIMIHFVCVSLRNELKQSIPLSSNPDMLM